MKIKLKEPHPLQLKILNDKTRFKVLCLGRRTGKDLWTETPVFTFNRGWQTIGSLEIGDSVMGSDGNPVSVIYLTEVRNKMGYNFTFSTDEDIIASKTHDWVTFDWRSRMKKCDRKKKWKTEYELPQKRTSLEIVDSFYHTKKRRSENYKFNHAIRVIPNTCKDKRRKYHYFVAYERLSMPMPMRCVGVSSEDHLFAVGKSFILTHNTELGKIAVAEVSITRGGQAFWYSPTYKMSSQIWREIVDTFQPVISRKNEQERTILLTTGGEVRVFSAETYDSIRGLSPDRVIVDEAAMIGNLNDMWNGAVMPSLGDKKGDALFLSTPKGENYFSELFELGNPSNPHKEKDWQSWIAPSWTNPYYPRTEILRARRTMPQKLFEQEIMAKFMRDAGEVFIGVSQVATGFFRLPYEGRFCFGIDLGRKNDYTVIAIWDMNARQLVNYERFSKYDWHTQKERIKKAYDKWQPQYCFIEDNSMGDVVVSDLRRDGYRVQPFSTTNKSKREIIDGLAVAIQNKDVVLLNDRELILEFQAYQLNVTDAGNIKYGAPSGYHDDIVMACAIGYYGISRGHYVIGSVFPKIAGWS